MPNLHRVIVLLVTSRDTDFVRKACVEKMQMTEAAAKRLVKKATQQIVLAADHDRQKSLGEAVIRLDDIYEKCQRVQDQKTALAATDRKCKLLGLYDDKQEAAAEKTGETDKRLEVIHAYLESLGLGGERTPVEELARLAAAEVCRLRSEVMTHAVNSVIDDDMTEPENDDAEEESG